ncbi:MAG TPA: hypothetical protein VFI40_07035 [Nocardioides sp.]|nr:hypothetical protein [Nocardioides sp.]
MIIAALTAWVLTALMGGYLLATWIANGGLRPRLGEQPSRFAPQLIFGHGGLAATGLALWISYLILATSALAWVAVADLVLVAALGATMFGLWIRTARGQPHGRHVAGPRHAAEDHFPPPAVVGHGLFAVATFGLVLVTALQATG